MGKARQNGGGRGEGCEGQGVFQLEQEEDAVKELGATAVY